MDLNMTGLALPLLLLLCFHGYTLEQDNDCFEEVRVPRNTVWETKTMESLTINCTVYHCGVAPYIKWCKLDLQYCNELNETHHLKIQWQDTNGKSGISLLTFINISMNDSGLYRCEVKGNMTSMVGHSINVSVTAVGDHGKSEPYDTTTTAPAGGPNPRPEDWPLYVYATVGILGLIVTGVMIFCVLRRKGMKRSPGSKQSPAGQQTQNHTRAGRQASVPLNKDEVPLTSHQASQPPDLPDRPRSVRLPQTQPSSPQYECVYDNAPARAPALSPAPAPARRSTRTKRTPAKKAPPPSGGIYDNEREEPDTSIVYAALNHQVARKGPAPAQAHIPMEEFTEYAAIRVS